MSPKSDSDDEERQLVKQAQTIRKWSCSTQSYAGFKPFTSLIEASEPLLEPETPLDRQMLMLYHASLELTEVGISTVMAPTVARRFKTALEVVETSELNGLDEVPDPFYEDLFKEAMEAYTIHGRMESIVCEMELLIDGVLKVLDDEGDHDFDILTGKVIGVGLAPDEDEQKTNRIMERVFSLLAALSEEAKSFNYMAWLQAMGESDMEVTELVEEFINQKQEIRKLLWISNIEAEEFLTSRLLTAAMTFARWFDKMRKAADEFEEFLLKQYQEEGHYGYYKVKQAFQKQAEERKRWAQRLLETKEACKREAHESHGKRLEAQIEMRREREAEKEVEPPPVSGLPISDRSRKSRLQTQSPLKSASASPMAMAMTATPSARRSSWSTKRSTHMEEQIMTLLGHARQHLDDLQILAQEQKVRQQKAYELLLRMLMKSRVLERRKLRKATNISQRVNSLMPGRFVVMHRTKSWSELEDFSVTSSLLQQQAVCKELNDLTVQVELKDIWTGVEGKYLLKKKPKPKKQVLKSLQTQEAKMEAEAKSKLGTLWGKARESVAAGSAVSAILGIQATKEADATAAREAQLRAEAEAHAQQQAEATAAWEQAEEDDIEDLYNFPPHFSLVDVQLLLSDAAVTRTEKLRELRQEISKVVQHIGAEYGREAWEYNAQTLQAHSNYNPWAALMPVVEKEMMSLGESGRFFLSRQDAANLQDLMRLMRGVKSQLAVETANRSHFEDEEDRWTFVSEDQIRGLTEQLRHLHLTLNERKQKAAKLDVRAELTQELAHLHPELRSTYGLVQKQKPPKPEEEEEEEEQDDRADSFKTFLFALKFKHKMSEAQTATKLRETKVQLQATIANAQKMMGEDYEGTKKLEDEKEYAQTQVHYMRRLHVHIQMNESATYQLKQLRSERSLKKAQLKAAGVDVGDDEGDHRGLANAGATTPSPRGKGKKAKGSRGKGTATAGSAGSAEKGSPKRSARSGDQETRPQPRASWLAKASQAASQALALPDSTEGRRTPSPRQSPRQSPRPSTLPQIGEDTVASVGRASVFFKEDHSDRSRSSSASSGFFARPTLKKRNTIDQRKEQFNRLFTQTMQRRLRTATDKGAALIFRKSLADASKSQQITHKILESKRVDLQNLLRLTLQRFGIKTNQRIQSAKEQHARWEGEVAYLVDKLRRGQGMAAFWQDRYDGWLSQMEGLFGQSVFDAFVHADRTSDREQWSQRLMEALHEAFDRMREETPSLAVDVSRHIEAPEDSTVSTEHTWRSGTVSLGDAHLAKLMQRQAPTIDEPRATESPATRATKTTFTTLKGRASVLQHNLPAPEAELVRPPPIPPRPMRQPGVSSAALRLPKMPIILQPEDEVDLPETHSKSSAISVFTSRQLPSWLTSKGRGAQSKLDLDLELDSDEISELEKNHVNLKRRRTVQPWLESVDWIEDVSYRAALRNLQKQFYRGKTQEEEAWGFPQAVQHHRHERKKITNPSALDRVAERNLSKKMHGFKLQEPPDVASMASHQWPASRPCKSLGRGRPRSKAEKTMECIVANRGVHFRGLPDRLLYQEPSVATSGTEVTEVPEGCLGDFQGASALRRLRRFRRKMLERFAGAEEAYNFVVTNPIGLLDYDTFGQLATQISFTLDHTRMVWERMWEFLGRANEVAPEVAPEGLRKNEFAHVMSFACSLRDLTSLRIRLQLRYGSLSTSFDQNRKYLDPDSWNELLASVGASNEEAKNFFRVMMANSQRRSPKISRRLFLLVLRNAEGFVAARGLLKNLKLSNEATAWRALMEHARRTAKHKGIHQDNSRSITATELQQLLSPQCNALQCEALLRMALAKQQRERSSGALRLEEVLLVAVAGLGQRADELRKELGRDYDGEDVSTSFATLLRQPGAVSAGAAGAGASALERLRRSMTVSVAEAARKLQRGEPHQGATTLLGIVGKRPPSHVRSYQSSDTEDPSISSRSPSRGSRISRHSSPRPETAGECRSPGRSRILDE